MRLVLDDIESSPGSNCRGTAVIANEAASTIYPFDSAWMDSKYDCGVDGIIIERAIVMVSGGSGETEDIPVTNIVLFNPYEVQFPYKLIEVGEEVNAHKYVLDCNVN